MIGAKLSRSEVGQDSGLLARVEALEQKTKQQQLLIEKQDQQLALVPKRFKMASQLVAIYPPDKKNDARTFVGNFNRLDYFDDSRTLKIEVGKDEVYTGVLGAPSGTYIASWFIPKSPGFNDKWHEAEFRCGDGLRFAGMSRDGANFVVGTAVVLYYE